MTVLRPRLETAKAEFDDELARRFAALPDSTLDRLQSTLGRLRSARPEGDPAGRSQVPGA